MLAVEEPRGLFLKCCPAKIGNRDMVDAGEVKERYRTGGHIAAVKKEGDDTR